MNEQINILSKTATINTSREWNKTEEIIYTNYLKSQNKKLI